MAVKPISQLVDVVNLPFNQKNRKRWPQTSTGVFLAPPWYESLSWHLGNTYYKAHTLTNVTRQHHVTSQTTIQELPNNSRRQNEQSQGRGGLNNRDTGSEAEETTRKAQEGGGMGDAHRQSTAGRGAMAMGWGRSEVRGRRRWACEEGSMKGPARKWYTWTQLHSKV